MARIDAEASASMDRIPHITLQSSCGDFDPDFLKRLPALEKAMIDRGIDPSSFIVAKNSSQATRLTILFRPTGHPIDYTVFVNGRSFTVTYQNDMSFLRYFYALCVGDDISDETRGQPDRPNKLKAWIGGIMRWFNQPI
jgi:hypothetical protein